MMKKSNAELRNYIQNQISQIGPRLEGYTKDIHGKNLLKRNPYVALEKYAVGFSQNFKDPRIIVMPGLRGVGKTTLLAQLFSDLPFKNTLKIYLSVDEVVKRLEVNLWDIIETYEELIGKHIESLDAPLFLFLDEIHYDKNWAMFLKTIYDRSKKVFIYCTGSAALLLRDKISADLARRVFFVDIHPANFSEYLMLKINKQPIKTLEGQIQNYILQARSAQELFKNFKDSMKEINNYWLAIDKFEIHNYLRLGTLPFTINSENDSLSLDYIGQMINKIIYSDLPQFSKFGIETLNKIEKILYLISDSLSVSITHLSGVLEIKKDTLSLILRALEKAGVLIRVPPYGAHYRQIKKPSKYLFASPSLRFFLLNLRDSTKIFDNYKGSLLEDLIAMYLNRILPKYGPFSLTYDVKETGADFIIGLINRKIIIEVGWGEKGIAQVQNTLKRTKGDFGLLISDSELSLNDNILKLPLNYFLLA